MKLFKPVYGYGWHKESPRQLIDVPEEFAVNVISRSNQMIKGVISSPHTFAGKEVILSPRTRDEASIYFNVIVYNKAGDAEYSGFAVSNDVDNLHAS
jgi:hypothetical protein